MSGEYNNSYNPDYGYPFIFRREAPRPRMPQLLPLLNKGDVRDSCCCKLNTSTVLVPKKKRHRRTFLELKRDFVCSECDRRYASEHSLLQHMKIKHTQANKEQEKIRETREQPSVKTPPLREKPEVSTYVYTQNEVGKLGEGPLSTAQNCINSEPNESEYRSIYTYHNNYPVTHSRSLSKDFMEHRYSPFYPKYSGVSATPVNVSFNFLSYFNSFLYFTIIIQKICTTRKH
jgi:hypothetical protein